MSSPVILPQAPRASRTARLQEGHAVDLALAGSKHGCPSPTDGGFDPTCCQSPLDRFFDGTPKSFFSGGQAEQQSQRLMQAPAAVSSMPSSVGASASQFGQFGIPGWPAGAQGPFFFCPPNGGMPLGTFCPTMPVAMAAMPVSMPTVAPAAAQAAAPVTSAATLPTLLPTKQPKAKASEQQPHGVWTKPSTTAAEQAMSKARGGGRPEVPTAIYVDLTCLREKTK